jgi:hypothetical protein
MRSPPPVLLIAFNRVDTLAEVIRALAPVAPSRMYVAADGPRAGRPDEAERCALVRRMLTDLPWRCEIKTRFLDANAGCARGVSGAISWFFDQESEGIVLEDDCVPDPSFFPYCAEMLERYRMTRTSHERSRHPLFRRASNTGIVVYLLAIFLRMGMGFVAAGLEPLRT